MSEKRLIIVVPEFTLPYTITNDADIETCNNKRLSYFSNDKSMLDNPPIDAEVILLVNYSKFRLQSYNIAAAIKENSDYINGTEYRPFVNPDSPDYALNIKTVRLGEVNVIVSVGVKRFLKLTLSGFDIPKIYHILGLLSYAVSGNKIPTYESIPKMVKVGLTELFSDQILDISIVHYPGIEEDVEYKMDTLTPNGVRKNTFTNPVEPFHGLRMLDTAYTLAFVEKLCEIKNYAIPTLDEVRDVDGYDEYSAWYIEDGKLGIFSTSYANRIMGEDDPQRDMPIRCFVKYKEEK